ncbi:MAG: response regulator transcription factor [Blastocatellia bacterium]
MIRILVADDHAILRRGLIHLLSEQTDMSVVGEAQNAGELFTLTRAQVWDIVILDVAMPGQNGLEILKQLKNDYPTRPVLMLSAHSEDQYAVRTLKAGASGYLSKDSIPEELVKAIRKAVAGGKYVSPRLAEKLADSLLRETDQLPHETLSDREFQVFHRLASGQMVSAIAEEMSLSVKTVSTYRTRVLEKMQLQNNAELTLYAIQHGLL